MVTQQPISFAITKAWDVCNTPLNGIYICMFFTIKGHCYKFKRTFEFCINSLMIITISNANACVTIYNDSSTYYVYILYLEVCKSATICTYTLSKLFSSYSICIYTQSLVRMLSLHIVNLIRRISVPPHACLPSL